MELEKGIEVSLGVDESRRKLNSRLHLAGHLLDVYVCKLSGWGIWSQAKAIISLMVQQDQSQSKAKELEVVANSLISRGGKVSVSVLPYERASELCVGCLLSYISKDSTPRIMKMGNFPGCPCGGTHVYDIFEIMSMEVSQIQTKKGTTKVFYTVRA